MQNLETPFYGGVYGDVLLVQGAAIAVSALLGLLASGWLTSISVLIGGGAVFIGSLAYAFVARPAKVFAVSGKHVFIRHLFAEVAKLTICLGLVFGAFVTGSFDGRWLLVGMGIALLAHWAAFLRSR